MRLLHLQAAWLVCDRASYSWLSSYPVSHCRCTAARGRSTLTSDVVLLPWPCRCRAEQLCHIFRNGLDAMWLATTLTDVQKVSAVARGQSGSTAGSSAIDGLSAMSEEQWMSESICVFQGDMTDEVSEGSCAVLPPAVLPPAVLPPVLPPVLNRPADGKKPRP